MNRQQMIEALMSYRDDKPKAFWETMDDDMLEMAISADGKEYKVKKPFYKRVWFWVLVIIVVAAIGGGLNNKGKSSSESTEKTAVSKTHKSSSSTSSSSEPEDKVYKVGEVASYKGYEIKVNNCLLYTSPSPRD